MFLKNINFVILAIIFVSNFCTADKCPKVKISNGEISGEDKESRNDRDFCAYRAIPYAKPPVGPLRFEPPQPALNWTGVKKLGDYGSPCVQFDGAKNEAIGKEDCLFINVFSPLINKEFSKKPLSVMVFIHGGYFMFGSADNYRPHYFMDEDVVIVTMNYRLGAFGFLNTEDGLVRGNMGLKDQQLALLWVRRNIRVFGGDHTRVTLFGHSAGAASVHFHLLSPMSKGLFQKAISQSGTATKVWALQTRPKESALRLGQLLNCDVFQSASETSRWQELNGTALVECMKTVDASKIAVLQKESTNKIRDEIFAFAPTIEVTHKTANDTFLAEHPYSILISGRQHRVPWIVGLNSEEGLLVTADIVKNPDLIPLVENNWDDYAPNVLQYNRYRTDITQKIRQFYFSNQHLPNANNVPITVSANGSRNITAPATTTAPVVVTVTYDPVLNFHDKFTSFTNLCSDRLYTFPSGQAILIQSKFSPVFAYYNSYRGEFSLANALAKKGKSDNPLKKASSWFKTNILGKVEKEPEHMGVCHGDENLLLFKYPDAKIKAESKDYQMSRDLVNLWIQFAYNEKSMKFGQSQTAWPAVKVTRKEGESRDYVYDVLRFSNSKAETGLFPNPISERMRFWESIEYLPPYQE